MALQQSLRKRLPARVLLVDGTAAQSDRWVASTWLYEAAVLRKVVEEDGRCVLDTWLHSAVERLLQWPEEPADVGPWLEAADLLCADLDVEALLHIVLHSFQAERRLRPVADAKTWLRRAIVNRDHLEQALRAEAPQVMVSSSDADRVRWSVRATVPESRRLAPSLTPLRPEALDALLALLRHIDALEADKKAEDSIATDLLYSLTHLLLCNLTQEAPHFLLQHLHEVRASAQWLNCLAEPDITQHVLLEAITALLAPGRPVLYEDFWTLCRDLYVLHQEEQMPLRAFLPIFEESDAGPRGWFTLLPQPTLSPLVDSLDELRVRVGVLYPWLLQLWEQKHQVFLTGSTLMYLLRKPPPCKSPGDVDLFVTQAEHLAPVLQALQQLLPGMSQVEVRPQKYRLTLPRDQAPLYFTGTAFQADVYLHPLEQIASYHLPCVRQAFDGTKLHGTAAAAVAAATMVNVDFRMPYRQEKSAQVFRAKAEAGFGFLLHSHEVRALRHSLAPSVLRNSRAIPLHRPS